REFTEWIGELIPLQYQESYDNSGLQVGDPDAIIDSVLFTLDVNEEVIREAVSHGHNLIVSHHPLIFSPLKRLGYGNRTERCVAEAISNRIAVYSAHTSFDAVSWGVSHVMAGKIGLENIRVLAPASEKLSKIVTFVPVAEAARVREAMLAAGAGHIGNYDSCSFNAAGEGTFRAGESAKPFAGKVGEMHTEKEIRIESVVPVHLTDSVVRALLAAHPYEEAAYDIIPLSNEYRGAGAGTVGTVVTPLTGEKLLEHLKEVFGTPVIRFSGDPARIITTVAVCGGSGASLISEAARAGADAFVTGDIKYHAFTEAPENMLVADVGHYESEKFSLQLLYELVIKKFPKFALRFSATKTNPINYFL
ncbi:MAG TPA: Nif3-like dinuclear metal center hexameric protein, partial [Bacteroidales bacterium]|nr:Nif3-like dinuclear metal center hexameric protein [Bacteroidales bacterium]